MSRLSGMTPLEILRAIDQWATETSEYDANSLWCMLSALRGPDNDNDRTKWAFTAPIRGVLIPALSNVAGAFYTQTGDRPRWDVFTREAQDEEYNYFKGDRVENKARLGPSVHYIKHVAIAAGKIQEYIERDHDTALQLERERVAADVAARSDATGSF